MSTDVEDMENKVLEVMSTTVSWTILDSSEGWAICIRAETSKSSHCLLDFSALSCDWTVVEGKSQNSSGLSL